MKKILPVLVLLVYPAMGAASLGGVGKVILRVMDGPVSAAPAGLVKEYEIVARHKGFQRAAMQIGRNLPSAEREKAAGLLENVLIREYARRGYSQSVMMTCADCVPASLADDINGRAMEVLRRYKDLVAKVSLDAGDVAILDSAGRPAASSSARREALKLLERDLGRAAKHSEGDTWDGFYDSLAGHLKNLNADITIDAEARTLSVRGTAGPIKGGIVNLDFGAFLEKLKHYLYGGGLVAVGYSAGGDEDGNGLSAEKKAERMEILARLDSRERAMLMQQAEADYVMELYRKAYPDTAQPDGAGGR